MSLERVLEPEVMDSESEAQAYDSMDHVAVNALFCEDLLASGADVRRALDVGTGTALIPFELCRRVPHARVLGVDLAEAMLKLATANIGRAGLSRSVTVARADAKAMEHGDGSFSCVLSNTIIHHIPDPLPAFTEMMRVLEPGGVLFVRDLIRPDEEEEIVRLVAAYTADADQHQQQLFDASLRAAFTLTEVQGMVLRAGVPGASVRRTSDRHWTLSHRKG